MKYWILVMALGLLAFGGGCAVINAVGDLEKFVTELIVGKSKNESKRGAAPYKTKPYAEWDGEANCKLCKHPLFRRTAKQRVRSLCGLGVTVGLVLLVGAIIAALVANVKLKVAGPVAIAGAILTVFSILLDAYLNIVLIVGAIAIGAAAVYALRRHLVKLKAMARFGDAVIEAGELDEAAIHAAADEAIGPAGSPLREDINSAVIAARKAE